MSGNVDQIRAAHLAARPDPAANPAWANAEHDIGVLLAEIERLNAENAYASSQAEIERARAYLRNLLTSFVQEHCDPVLEWAPLPDLWGMLTQIDNAITVTRDRQSEIVRMRKALERLIEAADNMGWKTNLSDADEAISEARAALSGSKE